jgi:hypothetical protein
VYDDSSDWQTVSSSVGTDERVEDLEEDEDIALVERMKARDKGEDVGWSSLAEETLLHAPSDTTDEQLMRYLKVNYTPDALAKLQVIYLHTTQVTDATATALAKGCPDLQEFDLGNTQVTDAAATALAKGCPGLREFALYNTQVTDAAVTTLTKGCPDLHTINLANTQVTPSLAKFWSNDTIAENKQHPLFGGTIKDLRKQLNRITKKKAKGKGTKKRR